MVLIVKMKNIISQDLVLKKVFVLYQETSHFARISFSGSSWDQSHSLYVLFSFWFFRYVLLWVVLYCTVASAAAAVLWIGRVRGRNRDLGLAAAFSERSTKGCVFDRTCAKLLMTMMIRAAVAVMPLIYYTIQKAAFLRCKDEMNLSTDTIFFTSSPAHRSPHPDFDLTLTFWRMMQLHRINAK